MDYDFSSPSTFTPASVAGVYALAKHISPTCRDAVRLCEHSSGMMLKSASEVIVMLPWLIARSTPSLTRPFRCSAKFMARSTLPCPLVFARLQSSTTNKKSLSMRSSSWWAFSLYYISQTGACNRLSRAILWRRSSRPRSILCLSSLFLPHLKLNMATFVNAVPSASNAVALSFIHHARKLALMMFGEDHPEISITNVTKFFHLFLMFSTTLQLCCFGPVARKRPWNSLRAARTAPRLLFRLLCATR